MAFEARWTSECFECLGDIVPGQMAIVVRPGVYRHQFMFNCETAAEVKKVATCDTCWMALTPDGKFPTCD